MNNSHSISAREIGERIGATDVEVNRLLKDQGFLYGEPSAYGLTPKGLEYGFQLSHDNGYGSSNGSGKPPTSTPASLRYSTIPRQSHQSARRDREARRQALNSARRTEQAQADATFQADRDAGAAADAKDELDVQMLVLIAAGVVIIGGAGYAIYRGVRWYKRRHGAQPDPDSAV